nr:AT-rich interactive domain-containing protein 1B-like isoform X1 [Dromaius novaehollandiae]
MPPAAAGGQQRPVGRAGWGGGGGGGGGGRGGGFLPEGAAASLLALQQAALAGPPVLEAAVGRQAAAPRRAARRRGVAEQFPAEAQDVLHVEVFPAGAGHAPLTKLPPPLHVTQMCTRAFSAKRQRGRRCFSLPRATRPIHASEAKDIFQIIVWQDEHRCLLNLGLNFWYTK